MRLPSFIRRPLLNLLQNRVSRQRVPDVTIGPSDSPYLMRWYVIPRNRWMNVYFHLFLRSDDDRAHHDHPWCSMSILLKGCYLEHMQGQEAPAFRPEGHVGVRSATALHRVELFDKPVWTLFLTGPKTREWGFQCSRGWRHWKTFTDPDNPHQVGRGCD